MYYRFGCLRMSDTGAAAQYLIDHQIPQLVNELMEKLLAAKPLQPVPFLLNLLDSRLPMCITCMLFPSPGQQASRKEGACFLVRLYGGGMGGGAHSGACTCGCRTLAIVGVKPCACRITLTDCVGPPHAWA